MKKLDENKLKNLHNANELLDIKYGKKGTPKRDKFEKEAIEYYNEIVRSKIKNTFTIQMLNVNDGPNNNIRQVFNFDITKGVDDQYMRLRINVNDNICLDSSLSENDIRLLVDFLR